MSAEEKASGLRTRPLSRTRIVALALVCGLGWGGIFALLEGVFCLLEGDLSDLWPRLQAVAFLIVLYALVLGLGFGLLGGLLAILPTRARRWLGPRSGAAAFSGLACAVLAWLSWTNRFSLWTLQGLPSILALFLAALGGVLSGRGFLALAHWWQSGRGVLRPLRWTWVWRAIVVALLVPTLALLLLLGYREWLYEQPWFFPPDGLPASPEQPNVVLISIDTLRADYLGAYGYPAEISPRMDALARQGVLFENAFSQAPWTMASMGSLMTSLYPTEVGLACLLQDCSNPQINAARFTLAEMMDQAGYTTAAFLTNAWLCEERGFCQGFDICGSIPHLEPYNLPRLEETALFQGLERLFPATQAVGRFYFLYFDPGFLAEGEKVNLNTRHFLRRYRKQRFFLWLHYMEPHATYDPSEPFWPIPAEVSPEWVEWERVHWLGHKFHHFVLSDADVEALRSLYAGEVRDMDALVGEVLDQIAALGLADRTVVVITADHGDEFAEHGDFRHGQSLYRELLHVPLIIAGPSVLPGRRVETPVALVDIFPTLAEIVGGKVPPEAHGQSLLPFLRGGEMAARPVFSEGISNSRRPHEYKAIRQGSYVLIHNVQRGDVELYDLSGDPWEQVNLREAFPQQAADLMAKLQAWFEETTRSAAELPMFDPTSVMDERDWDTLHRLGY